MAKLQISENVKDTYRLIKDGAAFVNPVEGIANNVSSRIESAANGLSSALAAYEGELDFDPAIASQLQSFQNVLGGGGISVPEFGALSKFDISNKNFSLASSITELRDHTNGLIFGNHPETRMINGLGSVIGLSNAKNSLENGLNDTNECGGIDNILGSITGAANDIMKPILDTLGSVFNAIEAAAGAVVGGIGAAINQVMNVINQAFGSINQAINWVSNKINEAVGLVAKELGEFLGSIQDLMDHSLAGLLNDLDPCFVQVVQNVGTPSLKGVIGNVGGIDV